MHSYTLWPLWIDSDIGCTFYGDTANLSRTVTYLLSSVVATLERDGDTLNEIHDGHVRVFLPVLASKI